MNRIVPLVLAVALFMEQMDSTVISTSLPAIAADIGTSPIALKLALTAYLVSLAVFIPVSGWMADRFGAKNVFRAAIVVFVLGSIACAVSNSLLAFVMSRFFQGVGGAMMTPVGRLVLVRSTPRNELVGAMAWLTMPALIGPLLGPPVGGFLTTYFSWHWIFLINVPIGIIGIWFATRYLPAIETLVQRPLDVPGFFLSGIAASGIVFGLSVVSLPALPTWVGLSTLALGIVSTILYLLHARRTAEPLLALDLFNNQVFRASIVGGSLFRIGVGAVPFLLPLMFQIGFGMTPFQSGLITFVSALGAMSMKLVTKWFYQKTGFRNSLMYGSVVAAAFIAINGFFTPETPYWLMVVLLACRRFLPLSVLHRDQCPRLCGYPERADEPRDAHQFRGAANLHRARRCGRRRHSRGFDQDSRRTAAAVGFPHRILYRCGDIGAGVSFVQGPKARCGRRGLGTPAAGQGCCAGGVRALQLCVCCAQSQQNR